MVNSFISARWDVQIFVQAVVLTLIVGLIAGALPGLAGQPIAAGRGAAV